MRLVTETKELTVSELPDGEGAVMSLRNTSCSNAVVENEVCMHLTPRNSLIVAASLLEPIINDVSAESILRELHKLQGRTLT